MATMHDNNETVVWPKRAVVTAGMPYGNKPLHFGHIAGVFVPADCFARFLRDRIGAENVRFISGTDCFGSPINEGYRKLVEAGQFDGTIEDYVLRNHNRQKDTLDSYDISLDIYEGSNIGHSGEVHQLISEAFIKKLYENGWLQKRATLQFYDPEAGTFLNGRQVQGHCPVQGCKSEHAYADECDLGHSYAPEDLIAPKSSLTGVTPEMRPVENWYFDLPAFNAFLKKHVEALEADPEVRPIVPQTIKEFLAPPVVYIKNELHDQYLQIADKLAHHQYHEAEKGKQSFEIEFDTIDELKEDLKKQAAQSKESQQALAARDALIDLLLDKVEIVLPESAVDHQVEHRVGEDAKPKAKKEAREAVEKEIRTELLSEALAKKFDVQVSQQELIDYAIQMSQNFGIDINQLFSSSQQMANVVADLGRSKALIEALKVVTVKDTNGADVDLSKFFGTDPATEEGAEIITEVADEQE